MLMEWAEAEREGSGEKTQKLTGERPLMKGAEKGDNGGRDGGAHTKTPPGLAGYLECKNSHLFSSYCIPSAVLSILSGFTEKTEARQVHYKATQLVRGGAGA